MSATAIDETRLEQFMGQMVGDMSAQISAPLTLLGGRLGLYRAMAHAGPLTAQDIADRTDCDERMVREWLANQTAGGYVTHDAAADRYELPNEHAMALADEDSPAYVMGAFDLMASIWADEDKLAEAFRTGDGLGWHEHDHRLFSGTERFFRPGYRAHLTTEWIPALDGMEDKLEQGASVADVGCGHGASTIIMAEAYPRSTFVGFDYHEDSLKSARDRARRRAWATGSPSSRRRHRTSPVPGTTWCATSTACTTWVTLSALPAIPRRRWRRTART
ncbi:MAG TPA: class I SAM-dependent methyltransferase [Thermoleophilaceae bacterium]|nr:class I SAM-dependent methyltransferase [Thermoleophilaceae bacterium]